MSALVYRCPRCHQTVGVPDCEFMRAHPPHCSPPMGSTHFHKPTAMVVEDKETE